MKRGWTHCTHIYIPVHCLFGLLIQTAAANACPGAASSLPSPPLSPDSALFIDFSAGPWPEMWVPTALESVLPTPLHLIFDSVLLFNLIHVLLSSPLRPHDLTEQQQLRESLQLPANSTFHECCRVHLFRDGKAFSGTWCDQRASEMQLQPLLDSGLDSADIDDFVECLIGGDRVEDCCAGGE